MIRAPETPHGQFPVLPKRGYSASQSEGIRQKCIYVCKEQRFQESEGIRRTDLLNALTSSEGIRQPNEGIRQAGECIQQASEGIRQAMSGYLALK